MKSQIIIIVNTQKYIERITPNSKVVLSTAIFCFVCRPRINNKEEAKHPLIAKANGRFPFVHGRLLFKLRLYHKWTGDSVLYVIQGTSTFVFTLATGSRPSAIRNRV